MMLESDALIIMQTAYISNQPFFCYTDRPTVRQERCAFYDAREQRANNNANSIHIQSAIFFCYPDRPYAAREWHANNNTAFAITCASGQTDRQTGVLESDALIIIVQRALTIANSIQIQSGALRSLYAANCSQPDSTDNIFS